MSTISLTDARSRVGPTALVGAVVFLLGYLAVSPVSGLLSTGEAPLPDASDTEIAAFVIANPAASWATAILQTVSVVGLAVFGYVVIAAGRAAVSRAVGVAAVFVIVSVAAMVISSGVGAVTAVVAHDVSAGTVGVLRLVSFYAGGVANVASLGVVVIVLARLLGSLDRIGRASRVFGYIAGGLAVLSVLSLVFWYANAFLPVGRVLSMVWTVVVSIVLVRDRRGVRP